MDVPFPRRWWTGLVLALAVLGVGVAGCGGGPAQTGIKLTNSATTTGSTPNTHAVTSLRIVAIPSGAFTDHTVSIAPGTSQFFQLSAGTYGIEKLVYDDGLPEAAASPPLALIFVSAGFTANVTVQHGP